MDGENSYSDEMREKSNFDLQEIIKEYPNESREKVIAALRELGRRDVLYSQDRKLLEDLEEENHSSPRTDYGERPSMPRSIFRDPNIVDDFKAPRLYSRYALRFFAVLFSPFFAGILLGINFQRLGKKREIYLSVIFSFAYSIFVFYISGLYPEHMTTITLIMNLIGSLLLEEFFWNRYIGKHYKFRRQPVGGALMIGFGISFLMLYFMFS